MFAVIRQAVDRASGNKVLIPCRQSMFKSLSDAEAYALEESKKATFTHDQADASKEAIGQVFIITQNRRFAPWNEVDQDIDGSTEAGIKAIVSNDAIQRRLRDKTFSGRGAWLCGQKVNYDFSLWRSKQSFVPFDKRNGFFKHGFSDESETQQSETQPEVETHKKKSSEADWQKVENKVTVKREKPAAFAALGDMGDAIKTYVDGGDSIMANKIIQMDKLVAELSKGEGVEVDFTEVNKQIAQLKDEIKDLSPKKIEVTLPKGKKTEVEGIFHEKFEELLKRVQVLPNAYLFGPSGAGKTHASAQLAKALDLPYYTISCSAGMSEGHLLGRLLPTGENGKFEFTKADFLRAFEEGGIFLLDEVDAADPNVMIVINDAISGGRISVPNRPEKPWASRHKDFILIAAGNTLGNGRDRMYVGRNQLDQATLRRFKFNMMEWGYSPRVEKALCPNNVLRTRWESMRVKAAKAQIRRVIDTQSLNQAHLFTEAFRWSVEQCVEQLQIDWTDDERAAVNN
jgi:hypothetical protein